RQNDRHGERCDLICQFELHTTFFPLLLTSFLFNRSCPLRCDGHVSAIPYFDLRKRGLCIHTTFLPNTRETKNKTRKITNKIFAIPAAVPAMPANPNRAASSAIIRKVNDQFNIRTPFSLFAAWVVPHSV